MFYQQNDMSHDVTSAQPTLSDREKFCNIFRIQRSFISNFGFFYMFYTFKLLPHLKIGRSQPAKGNFFSQITP